MIGTIISPIAIPAIPALKGGTSTMNGRTPSISGLRKISPKIPIATVGIPASTSSTGLITFLVFGEAYSERKIAEASPIGTATSMPQRLVLKVPTRIGSTPKSAGVKVGAQVVPKRKSPIGTFARKSMVGSSKETTIAVVVSTERRAQSASRPLIAFSP